MDGIQTVEDFEKLFREIEKKAKDIFIRDRHHTGTFFLIMDDGKADIIPFDFLLHQFHEDFKIDDEDRLKTMVFDTIGHIARKTRSVGYVHVTEAWTISLPEGMTDSDRATEFLQGLKEKYGSSLESVPGRSEILSIAGRYKNKIHLALWKVKRFGDERCLEPMNDISSDYEACPHSKIYSVDKSIDELLGNPSPKEEEKRPENGSDRTVRWR